MSLGAPRLKRHHRALFSTLAVLSPGFVAVYGSQRCLSIAERSAPPILRTNCRHRNPEIAEMVHPKQSSAVL